MLRAVDTRKPRAKAALCAFMFGQSVLGFGTSALAAADQDNAVDSIKTATPIKHVVIVVGENRSFDHLFATYVPKHKNERVLNLLSEGIIKADGSPGSNFAKAHQFQIVSVPNGGKYFNSADLAHKQLYTKLPAPDVNGVGPVSPYTFILSIPGGNPGLPSQDQFLFGTGGTGLSFTFGPDIRIANVDNLAAGPFQLTGTNYAVRCFYRRHDPSVLSNGTAGRLRHRLRARIERQPDRLSA